jgi:hypothetical protein
MISRKHGRGFLDQLVQVSRTISLPIVGKNVPDNPDDELVLTEERR